MGRGMSPAGKGGGSGFKVIGPETDDAYKFFGNERTRWEESLTDDERKYVRQYTGTLYGDVNESLRKGDPSKRQKEISEIDSAISKFELKENIQVYRGGSLAVLGGATTVDEVNAMVGSYIRDKGFVSTSTRPGVSSDWLDSDVFFEINVKKGKGKGAYVDGISTHQGESEFLVARNKFMEIKGARMEGDRMVVSLEY